MARAKQTTPLPIRDRRGPAGQQQQEGPTWKTVFLIWALCVMPALGGAGYVLFERYPQPFVYALDMTIAGASKAQTAFAKWRAERAKAAAAEEAKRKAAEAAAAATDAAF